MVFIVLGWPDSSFCLSPVCVSALVSLSGAGGRREAERQGEIGRDRNKEGHRHGVRRDVEGV